MAVLAGMQGVPNKILETENGSGMWGMKRPESDTDLFLVFVAPTDLLLNGKFSEAKRNDRSKAVKDERSDDPVIAHEIGNTIHLLLGGNVNMVTSVLSPVVLNVNGYGHALRKLVADNPSKNMFHSTAGMCAANMKRYVAELQKHHTEFSQKKAGQILRVLQFTTRILDGGKPEFRPTWDATREQCEEALVVLKRAYENSALPERPDEDVYRRFLLDVRLNHLSEQGKYNVYRLVKQDGISFH